MSTGPQPPAQRMRGMALIAVLWLVAAMSILVMGATSTVQQHIRATGAIRDQVTAQALAEGAIALALQQLVADNRREPGIQRGEFAVQGTPVTVELVPLNGWIDLNSVNAELLTRAFVIAGQLDAGPARALAEVAIDWRETRPEIPPDGPRNSGVTKHLFESVDDLMLVPGMDYDVFARVRPLFVTGLSSGSRVNPLAAPPEVLAVLADGNQAVVEQISAGRVQGATEIDTSRLMASAVAVGSSDQYRAHADIPMEAGKIVRVTQDVALGSAHSKTAPWRVLRQWRQVQPVAP